MKKEKEVELFLEMDIATSAIEKALAFKRWKDHILKYATLRITLKSNE